MHIVECSPPFRSSIVLVNFTLFLIRQNVIFQSQPTFHRVQYVRAPLFVELIWQRTTIECVRVQRSI